MDEEIDVDSLYMFKGRRRLKEHKPFSREYERRRHSSVDWETILLG